MMRLLAREPSARVSRYVYEIAVECELSGAQSLDCIDRWLRARFRYRGEIEEVLRTPDFMLRTMEEKGYFDGDCDDISTLAAAILWQLAFDPKFVAIRYSHNTTEFQHVFVQLPNGFIIDPTVEPGTPYNILERMELDV